MTDTPASKNSDKATDSSPQRRPGKRRKSVMALLAMLFGLLPFVVLEFVLAGLGIGNPALFDDPYVGFSSVLPLFEPSQDDPDLQVTSRSKRLFFGNQEFKRSKDDGTFRIFCLGGSTVRGRPYENPTSFAKWLELELNALDDRRHYESINCGGLSYASYRLTNILDEVFEYDPDLIVVATGHNEFLEDRTYSNIKNQSPTMRWLTARVMSLRLANVIRSFVIKKPTTQDDAEDESDGKSTLGDEVKAKLDLESGYASYQRDDEWRANVQKHFGSSIRGMIQMARKKSVPIVFVALGSNLRDCPPFKSEHKPGLTADELRRWQKLYDEGNQIEGSRVEDSIELYKQALEIDDEYALLHYRLARCYDELGELEKALNHYKSAKHWDICPLRMLEPMYENLKTIVKDEAVPLVDAQTMLEATSEHGLCGTDLYVDHVHPAIHAHQFIAKQIVSVLQESGITPSTSTWNVNERRKTYREYLRSLDANYFSDGSRRVKWLEGWARRNLLAEETYPVNSAGLIRFATKRYDFGDPIEAIGVLETVLDREPEARSHVLDYLFVLFQSGRAEHAIELISELRSHPKLLGTDWSVSAEYALANEVGDDRRVEQLITEKREHLKSQKESGSRWLEHITKSSLAN